MGSSRVQVKCPACEHVFLPSVEDTQSRAGKSSRRKGHAFERLVAKKFKIWWNRGRTDAGLPEYDFKRSPQSGGSALKEGFAMHGDVVSNAPNWVYSVECKNAPGSFAGIHQFMSAPRFVFWQWLEQATNDCPANKIPMIIMNRYDQPTWCASPSPVIRDILENANIPCMVYRSNSKYDSAGRDYIYIWMLDDMLTSDQALWATA